ncbi:chromate efflux transporter [Terriglobus albidus]|uniref:chromate efflux transporter n=1 Tax=Terriglobus albidus TaxID=1592106 RepID=UPI0021DF99D2|nr:chromate efflux transporter [Terriglobus albidus]
MDEKPAALTVHSVAEVFLVFLRLGCTSFGGPIAHLGYFQEEFVQRRRWLSADSFSELVAIAQMLPGPASSQIGYSIGLLRAGIPGGIAAWLGFTLPSMLLMFLFAFGHSIFTGKIGSGFLHGLQLVAVAVVAQAVLTMQRNLAPDRARFGIALVAVAILFFLPSGGATLLAIVFGAVAGQLLHRKRLDEFLDGGLLSHSVSKSAGYLSLALVVLLLTGSLLINSPLLTARSLFVGFFRSGSLVFGGGHVVLPLLENVTVARGWISQERFLAGYGAAQALPGPLFAYSAYLGASVQPTAHPILFGCIAVLAIFLPGLLLMTGVLPFWRSLRADDRFRKSLQGVNAAVVGILIAALYSPIWTSGIHSSYDFFLALCACALLVQWRTPPWIVVLIAGGITAMR